MNSASASFPADALESRDSRSRRPCPAASTADAWPVAVLGVPFDPVTLDGAIARIEEMIASRKPHYIVTANVDFLVQAHRDVELRRILLDADLVLCDGTPVVWASRWLGNPLPERVAGADLAPGLIQRAAEKGHRVFFLGAAPGVAAEAAMRLQQQFPRLNIVGHYAPPFAALLEMDHEQIVRRVREAKPDLLLVSFGCPKQEKWIAMHHRTLGVPVAIGVGATIDFLAGRVPRAPDWMRRSGTEWIFRLVLEPRRLFRRYAADLACFVPTFAAQWCRLWTTRTTGARGRIVPFSFPDWCGVDLGERLTRPALEHDAAFWRTVPQHPTHCVVDGSHVRRIDGTGVAFLLRWHRALRARRQHFLLLAPSRTLRRTLKSLRLTDHFLLLAPSRTLRRTLQSLRLTDHFLIAGDATEAAQQAAALSTQPTVVRDGTTRSLAWCGEIIAANAEDVWRMTTDHVRAFAGSGATLILIDLERLRFIDSSGAALMLRLKKWALELPAQILFTRAQANVCNVLRLTQLDQILLEGAQ